MILKCLLTRILTPEFFLINQMENLKRTPGLHLLLQKDNQGKSFFCLIFREIVHQQCVLMEINGCFYRERARTPPLISSSSLYLSRYYRERFGSHSPEDYLNLRFTKIDPILTNEKIKQILDEELEKLMPFEVSDSYNKDMSIF